MYEPYEAKFVRVRIVFLNVGVLFSYRLIIELQIPLHL